MLSTPAIRSWPSATDRVRKRSRRLVRLLISFKPRAAERRCRPVSWSSPSPHAVGLREPHRFGLERQTDGLKTRLPIASSTAPGDGLTASKECHLGHRPEPLNPTKSAKETFWTLPLEHSGRPDPVTRRPRGKWNDRPSRANLARRASRDGPRPLLGLVKRQKTRIDPALHAGVLDLDPVSFPPCRRELRAPGGSPKNGRVSGWCRPDVYAWTLQKDEIGVLLRRGSLGCHSAWSNLGRSLGGERSGNIGRRNGRFASWLRPSRSRLRGVSDDGCTATGEDFAVSAVRSPLARPGRST